MAEPEICAHTFSIVAADARTSEVGVAVATRLPAVGMYVPFAEAGIGAVASQAIVNPAYGPAALEMLRRGISAADVVSTLTKMDPRSVDRQLTVITPDGKAAGFTGSKNSSICGHIVGANFAVAGNLLATSDTLPAMEEAFLQSQGRLADRMLAALSAGEAAGGDSRGKQSAAILIVRPKAYFNGKTVDLRVDESEDPISELHRVYRVYMTSLMNVPGYKPIPKGTKGEHIRKLNRWLVAAGAAEDDLTSTAQDQATEQTLAALKKYLENNALPVEEGLSAESSFLLEQSAANAASPKP